MLRRLVIACLLLIPAGAALYYFTHYTSAADAGPQPKANAKSGAGDGKAAKDGPGGGKGGAGGRGGGPIPVVVAPVAQRDLTIEFSAVGRAEAPQSVAIRSRVDGVIQAVRFRPGESVQKGQVLVELDARQIEAQLRQALGNLARDQANLAKARADLDRYTDLAAKNFVAPSAVDGFKAAVATAEATVAFDQAAVDFARVQLEHTTIRAPLDGVTGQILVFPGGNVKANDTAIVNINQVQPILVSFPVPENQLPGIRTRVARGPVQVIGQPKDVKAPSLKGRLVFIDNAIDVATGTILLKAEFPNPGLAWTPGQFVNVSLVTQVLRNVIAAPVEAVQMGPSGNIAFVVNDGKVEVRPVKSFEPAGRFVVLPDSFKPGEQVVIDGQMRLFPGASVRIQPSLPGGATGESRS